MKVCPACGTQYGDDAAFCARDRTPLNAPSQGLIGTLLAERYQVERKLGEGGMGEVYLARHVMMGRPCALKVMSPTLTRDPEATGRFNREATNASRINHPNVCVVYDFGLTPDGLLYLAMEYLEGKTLSDVMKAGPLPLERAVTILAQCAAGLSAAHELGIVHRDLKPDNIMLVDQRGRETVKLVDFGIAKAGAGEGAQRVTRTGLVVGTPEYMSPEQFGATELDGRSDQYSLALVFYRMIAGALPFTATSAAETMAKRFTERPRPLREVAPASRFPAALQTVLDRALERKPQDRYPSIEAFAQAVAAASTADSATEVVPLPRTNVVPAPDRRRARLLMGAGGLALAIVGWLVLRPSGEEPADPVALNPPGAPSSAAPSPATASTTDTVKPPASTPPALPAPPPPPAPAPAGAGTDPEAIDEVEGPSDEIFDSFDPSDAPRRLRAARIARRIADDTRFPARVRARNAFNYGSVMLHQQQKSTAKQYFTLSCELQPGPRCSILDQLKDVP